MVYVYKLGCLVQRYDDVTIMSCFQEIADQRVSDELMQIAMQVGTAEGLVLCAVYTTNFSKAIIVVE